MKNLEKKLLLADFESKLGRLSRGKMISVLGGGSCERTGSSSKCDSTAVCNCNPPQKPKLIISE